MSRFLIDCFEDAVRRDASSQALLLEDGRKFTFGELDSLAETIRETICKCFNPTSASPSKSKGKSKPQALVRGSNDVGTPLVAVMMDRDVGFIASMLGILKAEGAYVPVDPAFPPDRQSHIFSHSQCELLIADSESFQSALDLGVDLPPYLVIDSKSGAILSNKLKFYSLDSQKVARRNDPESLAYVLYTSGSTGKPKGVMVKNIGVMNIIDWFGDELNVGPHSRVMGLTTFCFDISVLEMFLALTRGALLVLAKSSTQKDPFRLLEYMEEAGVTVFQATPTTYEMMFATGEILCTISFVFCFHSIHLSNVMFVFTY